MNRLDLHPDHLALHEDWEGANAAFTCPSCNKVFIVSKQIHRGARACPNCGRATGHVDGARKSNGKAWLEWS